MFKIIFVIIIAIIGIPVYALCVALLWIIGAIFDIGYVDASVYVCEYGQPIVTVFVAAILTVVGVKWLIISIRKKKMQMLISLCAFLICYVWIGINCVTELMNRIALYSGMTNRQIFNYVVHKLRVMGEEYPDGSIHILNETVTYGYVMANIEVYIVPISIVLLLGLCQRYLIRKFIK